MNFHSITHKLCFLIPLSLQPDDVDLGYFKLWILLDQIIQVWNIKSLHHQGYKDIENLRWW